MNTSLRRIAVMIMALIVLLLANATLTQVFTADGLRSDPRNQRVLLDEYSRQRGQISAGGQLLAYSVSTEGTIPVPARLPNRWPMPRSPASTRCSYSSTGLERAEDTILNGSDERLFGRRLADFFTGRDPRGGNVATTINPQVQQAAWDAMEHGCNGPCKGAVVALEPSTGKILAMVSAPSYDPNLLATHDVDEQSATWQRLRDDPDIAAVEPGDLGDLPARARRSRSSPPPRRCRPARPRTPSSPRRPEFRCRTAPQRWRTTADRRAAAARRHHCATRSRSPATPPSSNSASTPARTRCASTAQAFGLDVHSRRRSRCRWPSRRSARSPTPPRSGCRASGRRTSR